MIRLYRPDPALPDDPYASGETLSVPGGGKYANAALPFIRFRRAADESVLGLVGSGGTVCLGDFVSRDAAERVIRRAIENRDTRAVSQQIEDAGFRRDGRQHLKRTSLGVFAVQQSLRGTQVLYAREIVDGFEPVLTIQAREPLQGQQVWPPYMLSERNQIAAALGFVKDLESGGRAAWTALFSEI